MAKGGGENEYHVVSVRLRVTGSGVLHLGLQDLDNIQTQPLADLTLNPTTRIEPTRLANFQSQRIRLTGYTDAIDETFHIRRIVIFAKAVAMEYPG